MANKDYWYAVGKIRALEKHLLPQSVFEQAASGSLPEALKIFAEYLPQGDRLLQVKDSLAAEEFLAQEKKDLKELITGLLSDARLARLLEPQSLMQLKTLLKDVPWQMIADFFRHAADMHNIGVFLRLRLCRRPQQEINAELAAGGFVDVKQFSGLYGADTAVFLHCLSNVHKRDRMIDYSDWLEDGVKRAETKGSFVLLERKMKDFLIWVLRPAKYISCGPEPVLAYYYGRLNEIELIRLVLLGKMFHFDPLTMKERINGVYA